MNIMNYVDLSGIYPIRDAAYVFGETIINPPGLLFLGSNGRSSSSFIAFTEVGGFGISSRIYSFIVVCVDPWYLLMPLTQSGCKLPLLAEPVCQRPLVWEHSITHHRIQKMIKVRKTLYNNRSYAKKVGGKTRVVRD